MYGIIVNPNSKKNLGGKFCPEDLEKIMGKKAVVRSTPTIAKARDVFSEFFDRGVKVICISGGDGTQHLTLTELVHFCREQKRELPLLYPIRGGVMNMVSNEVATRFGNPATQCKKLYAFDEKVCSEPGAKSEASNLPFVTLPVLKIEDPQAEKEAYAFTFSNGILYKGLDEYNQGSKNVLGALWLALRMMSGAIVPNRLVSPTENQVKVNGKDLSHSQQIFIVASTIKKLVLWFSPFAAPEGSQEGEFYSLACGLTPFEILRHLPSYSVGKRTHERLNNLPARVLEIQGQEGYVLDGEVYHRPKGYKIKVTSGITLKFLKIK
jgi:hypothetical protein